MSCGVGRRRGSDLALLWLWHRPVATASIIPLAWEPPHAVGMAIKRQKKKKKKKKRKLSSSMKKSQNQEYIQYNFIYVNFKTKGKKPSLLIEFRKNILWVKSVKDGAQEMLLAFMMIF